MPAFGPTSTADEVLEGIDLTGRHAVVTGASAGLGVETTRALAARGASVTMAVRDLAKAGRVRDAIVAAMPGVHLELRPLDLSSLASVRAFADGLLAERSSLDLLIANAGIMACPYGTTVDGFELQLGTNHLGHFLLARSLLPLLAATEGSRTVVLTSSGHRISDVDLDDPGFERTPYDPWVAYGRAKTANALCAVALHRRLAEHGGQALAVHPGFIQTELGRHLTRSTLRALQDRLSAATVPPLRKTIPQGAATTVWAATSPDLAGVPAWYYEDCAPAELTTDPDASSGVRPYALDPDRAEALWALSERLVG